MNEIIVEKVLIPERDCRCGGKFFVGLVQGEKVPRTFHNNPVCPQLKRLPGGAYLHWVNTGEEPPAPPTPNRAARRAAGTPHTRGAFNRNRQLRRR